MAEPWISVEYHSGIPVYRQVINAITSALLSGEIMPGDSLPTIRNLAADLGINPNTVAKAYRELELTGLVASAGRNGTVVTGLPSRQSRTSPSEKEIKLKEIYARVLAEARAHGISEKELARVFDQGGKNG